MNIYEKLLEVQSTLKAPKSNKNTFGNYNYRSAEDILEAVKPLLAKNKLAMTLSDTVEQVGERNYVKACVTVYDTESEAKVKTCAYACEALEKKGMDVAQITGAASSYARKYALNGMFDIDDTKDADSDEHAIASMSPKDKELSRSKGWIFKQLNDLGYTTDQTKQNKIKEIIGRTSIFSQQEANEVTEALKIEIEELQPA